MKRKFLNYFKNYGFNSVVVLSALKLFIVFTVIALIPTIITYYITLNSTRQKALSYNKEAAQKVSTLVENVIRDSEYLSAEMVTNETITQFMSMNEKNVINQSFDEKLTQTLKTYMTARSEIDSIYLYNKSKNCFCTSEGIKQPEEYPDKSWLENYDSGFASGYKILPRKIDHKFVYAFTLMKITPNQKGCVVINIDMAKMKKKLVNLVQSFSDLYIMQNQKVIYTTSLNENTDFLKKVKNDTNGYINEVKCTFCSISSPYYNIVYILTSPMKEYTKQFRNLYITFILILVIFLIISVGLAILLSMNSSGYVADLINLLDTKQKPITLRDNEIKYISDRMFSIINDNEKLKCDIEKRIMLYDEIKRKTLQGQISPHFLNNSLSAINYKLIDSYGYKTEAGLMLTKLSRIYEYSYIDNDGLVYFKDEIEFIKMYTDFLKFRYGDFEFDVVVDPGIENEKVLKMFFQPLVENSVFHGFKKSGNIIKISCLYENDNILISVYDNGKGIENEKLQKICDSLDNDDFSKENIGIRNVYKRLKLMYSDKLKFIIDSKYNEYTNIKVYIPIKNKKDMKK